MVRQRQHAGNDWIVVANPNVMLVTVEILIAGETVLGQSVPSGGQNRIVVPEHAGRARRSAGRLLQRRARANRVHAAQPAGQRQLLQGGRHAQGLLGHTRLVPASHDPVATQHQETLLVANPGSATMKVTVKLGGRSVASGAAVAAGAARIFTFKGAASGPLLVTAITGKSTPAKVLASERGLWMKGTVFVETLPLVM